MLKKGDMCDCNIIHKESVDNTLKNMIDDDTIFDVGDFFKILGDSTRIKILFSINNNRLCVCDIANILKMSKSSISHQLKILRDYNIVKNEKIGKEVFYELDDNHVKEVFEIALKHINHNSKGEKEWKQKKIF